MHTYLCDVYPHCDILITIWDIYRRTDQSICTLSTPTCPRQLSINFSGLALISSSAPVKDVSRAEQKQKLCPYTQVNAVDYRLPAQPSINWGFWHFGGSVEILGESPAHPSD